MYDNVSMRRGKKYYENNPCVIKNVLEWNCCKIEELTISIPKKKQPILPEKIHQKLYGIPGQNIFTYDIDKPKPRKTFPPQIDEGMVPIEDSNNYTKCITRINIAFKDSLDKSLIPQENSEIKLIGRTVLNRDHISHLESDLLNMEESDQRMNPLISEHLPNIHNKLSRRKQFKDERENQLNASGDLIPPCEDAANDANNILTD